MATPTSNLKFNPNAYNDCGPSAAGCGRVSNASTRAAAIPQGLTKSGVLNNTTLRVGFAVAGAEHNNGGPNTVGHTQPSVAAVVVPLVPT